MKYKDMLKAWWFWIPIGLYNIWIMGIDIIYNGLENAFRPMSVLMNIVQASIIIIIPISLIWIVCLGIKKIFKKKE